MIRCTISLKLGIIVFAGPPYDKDSIISDIAHGDSSKHIYSSSSPSTGTRYYGFTHYGSSRKDDWTYIDIRFQRPALSYPKSNILTRVKMQYFKQRKAFEGHAI